MSLIINPYRFGSGGGGTTDPYWGNVDSLLHMDGANGSTAFTDEKGNVWTVSGSAQISTTQSKFGGASGLFDGFGAKIDRNITTIGSADFTWECWFRASSFPTFAGLVDYDNRRFTLNNDHLVYRLGTTIAIDSGAVLALNTWYHAACVRSSGVVYLFLDGSLIGTVADASTLSGSAFTVGSWASTSRFNGFLDDFRFTRGVARYTSSFTPPTAPYPNS